MRVTWPWMPPVVTTLSPTLRLSRNVLHLLLLLRIGQQDDEIEDAEDEDERDELQPRARRHRVTAAAPIAKNQHANRGWKELMPESFEPSKPIDFSNPAEGVKVKVAGYATC